ncbi:MAG: hypothetical protein PHR35_08225 [Kiritimatiellae bacterium]|nr:hypothetical protein [Kiritimatiellia bacterium]
MGSGSSRWREAEIENMARARREQAARLGIFDAGTWLGRPQGFPLARAVRAGDVGAMWRDAGIVSGLVSHWQGKTVSAQNGNQALAAALPELPTGCGLVWTGLPLLPGAVEPAPGLDGRTPERPAGVRLFPKSHVFPLAEWTIGSLCRWMMERRLPLFIWHSELDWTVLYSLAKAFPELTIVVESQPQKILYHVRPLFALMGECPKVLVETSNFIGQGVIEYTVRHFGPERLVFGSFLPVGDPLVPLGMLLDADIAEPDKALIAGGNLRRIFSEVQA